MALLQTKFCIGVSSSIKRRNIIVSQDASSTPQTSEEPASRPTYVILPKGKPQKWSTGVAPGEYGGPPLTTKIRKYWGGEEDPLTSKGDFIWNKEFMGRMKRMIEEKPKSVAAPSKEEPSGFLSLSRAMSLDSMELDLSKELATPTKPVLQEQVEAARRGRSLSGISSNGSPRWRFVPTRREQEKWDRANKAATGGSDVMLRDLNKERGDPKVLAARAKEQYLQLKQRLQIITLGIGGVGFISAYISYSPEVAASFGAGLLGSLAYIRMLGNSVDSMADGAKGLIKGAVGQPRLLVPVVLVMVYNRWNGILVPEHGFIQLDLIPMLVGFFTYKIATFVQAMLDVLPMDGKEKEA
ncbi:ATP synthase protein I [Nymphaea thermarum]|nr:ATP synthase protein I [Nymphaea thermarum]